MDSERKTKRLLAAVLAAAVPLAACGLAGRKPVLPDGGKGKAGGGGGQPACSACGGKAATDGSKWTRYKADSGDASVRFDYLPGYEPVTDEERRRLVLPDSQTVLEGPDGGTVHAEISRNPHDTLMNETAEDFAGVWEEYGMSVWTETVEAGEYQGFEYRMGPDPVTGNYTAGFQISDGRTRISLDAMRKDGMPPMFRNVTVTERRHGNG
ncbi:MAG: hypothetical protein IJ682_04625 [Lachnospiraceae bacterium]|nr:hypothetical protein [Lachnospiraceae bacterium]